VACGQQGAQCSENDGGRGGNQQCCDGLSCQSGKCQTAPTGGSEGGTLECGKTGDYCDEDVFVCCDGYACGADLTCAPVEDAGPDGGSCAQQYQDCSSDTCCPDLTCVSDVTIGEQYCDYCATEGQACNEPFPCCSGLVEVVDDITGACSCQTSAGGGDDAGGDAGDDGSSSQCANFGEPCQGSTLCCQDQDLKCVSDGSGFMCCRDTGGTCAADSDCCNGTCYFDGDGGIPYTCN
jgi:hypothetical protein